MLKVEAFSAYEFCKKSPEDHRAEEYMRKVTKAIQKMNRTYTQ